MRLAVCYIVCAFVLTMSFFGGLKSGKTENVQEIAYFLPQNGFSDIKEDITPSAENTQETAKEENLSTNSSSQVSATAVRGKIITKYISPYSAPQSYNKVYMKNSTDLNVNIKTLLEAPLKFKIQKSGSPQVLIMHTHTTETFMETAEDFYTESFKSRTTDNNKNMVKIGDIVAERLNNAGINTLHDATKHDYPEYTGSYGRSAKTVNSYLSKYKDIKIVLDLHRDSVSSGSDKVKLSTEIEGKKAAQVMLVMGSQSGSIKDHPNWQENLKLALKLQQTLEEKYPTLARPLSLMSKKYNQSLTTGSLLIEIGTEANTLEEACYSAELVGEALVTLLNSLN